MTETEGFLSKDQLANASKFSFDEEVLELPEIDGGKIMLKTLSVDERDSLPDLVNPDGSDASSTAKLAAYFSACVKTPDVTAEEAEKFLGKWPATALDKVLKKFAEMAGATKEEQSAAAGEFPGAGKS